MSELTLNDKITQEELDKFFLGDPNLCLYALPDKDLDMLYYEKKFNKSTHSLHVGVNIKDSLVAVVKMEEFSELSVCVHFYVGTKNIGTGISDKIAPLIKQYIKENMPKYSKVITTVPSPCTNVMTAIERFGMKCEAILKDIIIWRSKVEDLHIYSLNL